MLGRSLSASCFMSIPRASLGGRHDGRNGRRRPRRLDSRNCPRRRLRQAAGNGLTRQRFGILPDATSGRGRATRRDREIGTTVRDVAGRCPRDAPRPRNRHETPEFGRSAGSKREVFRATRRFSARGGRGTVEGPAKIPNSAVSCHRDARGAPKG